MKIGVIGGGQLGRMLALAGTPLGMNFAFLVPAPDACAQALGEHIRADYGDLEHLRQLADEVDLVTFEFESVPAETVAFLSQFVPVYPSASTLRIARDRWFEKSLFKDLGIPTPDFADIQSQADLDAAVASIGLPAVMKTRTLGYDGKGQKVLRKAADVTGAFAELGSVPCILEGFVPFTGEVSLVAVRARDGDTAPEAHQFTQHLGARDQRNAQLARSNQLRIIGTNGTGGDQHVGIGNMLRGMAAMHGDAPGLQQVGDDGAGAARPPAAEGRAICRAGSLPAGVLPRHPRRAAFHRDAPATRGCRSQSRRRCPCRRTSTTGTVRP